jgi:hypothetical protein
MVFLLSLSSPREASDDLPESPESIELRWGLGSWGNGAVVPGMAFPTKCIRERSIYV